MDYMREINAFERWLETNYLPCRSQLLWYRLMALCNRAGWPEWVIVDNCRLMGMIQSRREATAIAARDSLIANGFMEFDRGKKGKPNRYKMLTCTFKNEVYSVAQSVVNSVVQTEVQSVAQTADISSYPTDTRKTKTKTKTKTNTTARAPDEISALIAEYSRNSEVLDAISGYLEMRKAKKKPATARALKTVLKELDRLSGGDDSLRVAVLEQSTRSSWTDVYPLKDTAAHAAPDPPKNVRPVRETAQHRYTQRQYAPEDLDALVHDPYKQAEVDTS